MPDLEKVIKGLEICYFPPSKCEDCPYHDLPDEQSCNDVLCLDALAMLKDRLEIVLCKDCKHYKDGTGMCDLYHAHGCAETWFCADGER